MVSSAETVEKLNEALFNACENGNLEDVRRLLAQGADVNGKGLFAATPLMRAASQGHSEVALELIERGADVNARSWSGYTALMDAASWSNDVNVLKVLLDHKAEINAADEEGCTALMRAARRGRLDMVRLLVDRGARVDAVSGKGMTALWMAAEKNHEDTVRFLRKHGARYHVHSAAAVGDLEEVQRYASAGGDVDSREKAYGRSLLWMAAHNGHMRVVSWLLDQKADIEARGPNGETPLHAAAGSGHHEVVALLLDRGANIRSNNEGMGGTALHIACLFGHPETVRLLLDRGCEIETRTIAGRETPLMIASESGKSGVVRLLLERGAQIDAVDEKGRTALMKASERLELECVRALLDAEAAVRRKDKEYQYTALHYACCIGPDGCDEDAVRVADLLIRKGAQVAQADRDGITPLDCAAGSGWAALTALLVKNEQNVPWSRAQLETALLMCAAEGYFNEKVALALLQAGASINCKDADGYSPLMFAAEVGDVKAVQFFLSNGADTKARNAEGATAFDIASQGNGPEIIEILKGQTQK